MDHKVWGSPDFTVNFWQWKISPVEIFTVNWYFLLSVKIFTVNGYFYCQWKFSLSVVILTVKMWYFSLSNRYRTKNEFNLVANEDSSESWLPMKFFLVKKFFWTHVTCQNVPERVALVCVSNPGLQTLKESF